MLHKYAGPVLVDITLELGGARGWGGGRGGCGGVQRREVPGGGWEWGGLLGEALRRSLLLPQPPPQKTKTPPYDPRKRAPGADDSRLFVVAI